MFTIPSKQNLISKLPNTGTTIFTVMSQLAQEHNAINLAQGFPDFNTPKELISLVHKYMLKGYNQYAPMPGVMTLREKISEKTTVSYGYTPDPVSEITLTCGATEACYVAITAIVRPGDEVLLFEPAFDCYVTAIELCGATPVYIPMHYPHYTIDWEQVRAKVSGKTRMIILNSPHNPTGSVISIHDIHALQRILQENNIFLLSDEVYEHIIYDECAHESVLKYEDIRRKSFVISSLGKTFHCTGWRMGYCIAPDYLTQEFRKVHQHNTFSVHTPTQYAVSEYMAQKENYLNLPAFFQEKRDRFIHLMSSSRFELLPAKGSYFQLASYKNISDEKDTDFAIRITKEFKVATIPVSAFYHDHRDEKIIRFCFAKKEETLEKAAEVLCKI
ncbi:MAG TPA: methionine aminotransferase [Cytophagaceae bacterium]|jgi:methionine aminotransferase|nr:methionine aminotransferase [Cytophagaceae bacterium]